MLKFQLLIEKEYLKNLSDYKKYCLDNLNQNGIAIIKLFDFSFKTQNIIINLSNEFESNHTKNIMYQQYDNIKYLICLNYKSKIKSLINTNDLNQKNNQFINFQLQNIERFIKILKNNTPDFINTQLHPFKKKLQKTEKYNYII